LTFLFVWKKKKETCVANGDLEEVWLPNYLCAAQLTREEGWTRLCHGQYARTQKTNKHKIGEVRERKVRIYQVQVKLGLSWTRAGCQIENLTAEPCPVVGGNSKCCLLPYSCKRNSNF
jgi:hypothetical protein